MPQPQEGQPKGKVDVFGVLHDAATKDQQFDPYRYAHRLGSDSRKGLYDLHLDEAAVREKYKTDPAYAGPEGQKKLTDDLAAARGFLTLTQSDQYDSGYRAMPDVLSGSQIRPWVTGYNPVRDPYTTYDGRGNSRPTGGSRQKVAENLGMFYDRHGQLTPLTSKDIKERALEVTSEMATNAEGDVLERPVLRELRYGQSAYNKEMFSSWGGKAMSRTWLGAFMTDLAASVSGIQAGFGALAEQAAGMNSSFRASALMRAYDELGGPGKAATVNRMMERGVLYPEYANSTFIPSIDAPLTMARTLAGFVSGSAGSVTANQDEEFYKKIAAFKKDEANIRKQAAQGNPQAKIAADLLDIYDGMQGKSVIERIADTSYMLKGHMTPATSMRRDEQGMLGGAEAISGTLGSLAGFMIPGAALGRGVATGLLKYGGEALIARSVARGMQATLTKAGAQVAGFGGATAPALQMAQIGYYGARDAGYKHGQALKVATAMAPMAFMSEFLIGSPWLIKSMIGGGKGELTAAVAKALGKPAEIEKLSWNQQAFRGMIGMWQGLKKGSDNAALNTGANALEAALREFSQEFTEEGTYALIEEIQDQASGEYKYRNSRPKDYSLTNRLFENGAAGFLAGSMMGSLAGGRRQVQPYDERIAALVANGEANNVRKIAQKMREDGQITDETMQVLEQNIALSEDIMQGMNVSDPQVLEHLMKHQDLSGEYAQRSMEVKGAQARIAELDAKMQEGGSDNDALGREKKEIEEQITEHQARIGQILDGTEVVRRLKNSLMALKGAKASADGVDRTASAFRSYADKKRSDLETIRTTRGEGIEAINAELDALVSAKPGDTTEAVMTVQSGQANLQKTGSLLQEDMQRTLEILSLKKQEVMAEMMKVKPPSSESETDFQSMQQLVDELMQEGDGTTRDFLQEYEKQLYRAKPNEPVVQLYEEYKSLEAAERAYGADENNRTRFKQSLLTQKTLDQGYTQEELLEKFMMNLGSEQGNDVRDVLADARQQQETTDEQQKYLAQVIKALEGVLAVHEEMTTSMSEVAQRLPGSKVAKPMGQDLPAIQQLQQDDKQVYEAARNMNPESIALMRDTLAALRTEQERLDQQLSHRSAQLAKIHWAHQVLSTRMITMYGAFDPAMGKNKAYVDTMTLLEQEMEKGGDTVDVLIARLKDIISEQLVGNTSDAKRFLKHALDKFDWGNEKTNSALRYQETGRLNQTDMSEWFVETLFDDPNMGNTHLASGAVAVLTNFVSEVSRARTASLYQAYSEYTASVKALPNYEQERAALEVVSFFSSPDQELTRALIGAKRSIDADQAAYAKSVEIPNSIAVPGPPGVGKTKFIVPPVVSMFGKIKRRRLHVVVVTPGRSNGKEIHSELTGLQEGHRIVTIGFHEVASVAAMENVDLIIVDEAHAADSNDALAFKQMMESQPEARGLFLGDPMQAPSIANKDMVFPVERRMMRALPLQVTFRQTNIPIISTINELHAQVYKNRLGDIMEPRLPSTQYIERTNQGVRFITSSDRQVVSSFAEHMLRSVGDDQVSSNVMLITLNENDRQNALAILAQDPALLHSFPMDQLERRVLTMDKGAHSALGLEADIAFVAIKPQDLGSSYTRFLYTAISRGREGAVAFMPTGRSSPADSLPRINTKISSLNEMWTETAARVKSISDDLIPRLPKEGVKPVEPKKPTVNEEEQGEELTGDEVPPDLDEQAQAAKTTRYSTQYDKAPGFMPGSTITLAFNPDFPKGNASALSMKNPAYKLRMGLIQQVFTNPAAFPVKVIKREGAQYNSATGIYNAPGVSAEIHLTEDSEAVINTIRQQTIDGAKPVEYAELFATGATMLGTLYINTIADGSQLDQAQSQLMEALQDPKWEANASRPGYENLSLGKLYAGQRHAPFGREIPGKFSTFLSTMEGFGFHVSEPYMVPAKTKEESWVGKDGVVRPQVMVDVSPYPGGPLTKVFLSGGDLDEAYYTRMYEGIANAAGTGTTADVLAFSFLQWNRSRLIENGQFVIPELAEHLIIREGKPDVMVKRSEDLAAWSKHLRSAIEIIQANKQLSAEVTKVLRINKNARSPNGYDTIQIEDQEHAVASVARVNMPAFTVNLSRVVKTTPKASGRVTGVPRTKLKTAYTSGKLRRESIVKTENYFRKVFGNRFVDGQLEFKPRLTTRDGRALWGVMENGRIALEAMDGTVRAHVGRHEAAHRVVEYLLDEESYRRVMDEAEMRVAKARGVKSWQVNPDDVHEFISEQYEKPTYHTDTLFGRFMRWLKGVMKRWNLYSSAIDDLLYAIEDGAFKDAPERSREEVTRYSEKIPDEQALQGSYAISNVEPVSNPERITFRNRNFLNELFIDSVTAQGIVDLVAQRLLRASQYQVPADKDLTLPLPSLKDAYHEVLGAIKLASKEVDPTGLDGLNKQQLLELDDDRWDDYKTVKLADNSIFNTVFQSVFPGIDMEQMLLDGKLYSENEEVDIDEDMLDRMSAHIHNSNENTDPFERQSALTQLHLQTVRMITTPEEGGVAIENENEAGVDLQMLQAVMVDAAYMSIYSGKGVSSMEIMKERLLDINKKFPGTKRAAHAMTMYHRYLDPSGYYLNPEGQKTYSYRYLLENADSLMLKAKTPVAAQNLQGRIDQARTALTNVVRSFRELAGVTYKITEFSPGEFEQNNDGDWTAQQGRMNHRTFGFGSGNEIKNEINRQLDLGFVASGSDAVVVDPDYRKQWIIGSETDEQQGFTINEQGVFMPDGTPLVEILSKGFLLKNRDAELINGFFSAAGYVPHTKTIELLLAEESGHKLARIIGFWSMAIHASLHQVESGRVNSELFSRKKLEESKSAGVGTRTSADLHSSRDLEGKQYPLPSTLIGINESLSEIETASQGRSHLPRLMSVKGKPIHSINLGSLKTMLLPGSDGVTYSSKALEEYAETLVKRDPALRRADGTWLIPHLDPKDPCRISNVFLGSGIKDTSRGIGKDVLHMTELDIASEQVDFFAQQLLSGGRSERIVLGMHPDGDRNNITYTRLDDPFGTDKRVLAVDGKSVKFIPSVLQGWVMKAFAYHYEQHKASKARWTKHAGSDLKTIMADPEMMRFRDYVVKGDKALPGNATEFNTSGIYNKQNYERILAASKDGTLDSVIADIYKPYHEAFVTKLFGKKATETEPAVEGIGYRWQPSIVKKTTPDSRQAMIEGLFYMTHLNDVFLSAAMQGSQFNYKNTQDFIKRSVGLQAPGSSPMPIAGGLGEELRVAIIAEPVEGKKVLDGQDYILPFMLEELKASFGGNEGVFRPTANKMVTFQNDLYIKSSQLPITHEIYQKNPWLADQVKRSLVAHPELLQTWNNAVGQSTPQQFAAAVKAVKQAAKGQVNEKGEVLKEEISLTTFLSSESNVKMGLRGVNPSDDSPLTTLGIDTRSLRLQTNLERSLKSLRAPFFNQYAGLMGVSPEATALVNELNRYTADLADKYLSDANEAIEKMPYVDRQDKVTAWIKQLGIRKTAQQGAIGQVVDMLSDPDSSINNPLLRRKIMQIVANELTVDAINPKMNGQMFTQVSGHGFLHIPIPETPAIIPHPNDTSGSKQLGQSNDAVPGASESGEGGGLREGSGEQPGVDAGTTSPDQLEPLAIAQDGAQAGAGLGNTPQPIALRPPRNEGGKYMRGEVMMPFLYAKEFGFEGEAWRDMSFKEVRADIYSRLKEAGVLAFDRAMNVFTVRGPSSGLGSGHLMKVVDFINYSGNVVIFPPEANEYTGGDNDGDQLTVYLRKLRGRKDAEGKVVHTSEEVSPNTVEGIQSRILDVVEAFYMGNEENGWKPVDPDLILQPVGTAELEETFEKELDANPDRYAQDKANTELFTPVHSIEARRMAADGVNLIGVMMQYMKGYSYLSQALNNADPGDGTFMDWTPQFKGDNDSYVSSNISQLGNGALDNTKLNIIGRIGINMHNVGLVMGAVMDGYGLADVIALAKDPMVLSMVRKLEKQDSLNLGDQVRNRTTMLDMLIEESGNPPLEVEGQQKGIEPAQLAHWAAVGEAVNRMAKIYSMGTDGIPIDDHGLDSLNHHIEATTSARMSDLIDGSLPTPDYYQLIEPRQRNRFIYQSREELVRSLFDPRRALQLQPNTMSQIRTLDWTNKLYADSLLERHPVLINAFKQFTYGVGRNEVLSENGRKVYNQQFTGMMISLYMDQQYGKLGSELITTSTGRSYGLGDKGGMDQYVRDFPDMWKNAVDQILRLPQTHPAREAYMNNKFLQEVEVSGKSSFKVQMRDGRRITNDPRLNEQVRRDASRIDAVFGHPDLGGFQGMQKRLSIYSQLKDRFSFDRNSFAPFLASTEDAGLGNLYDGMLTALQKVGKEIKLYPLSSGVTISVEEFIKEFVESLAATEGQLAPVWSKKESPTFTTYYATKKRVGFNSFFEVHSRMLKDSGSEALFAIRSYIEGRLEKDKSYYGSPEYHRDKAREVRMRSAPVLSNPSSRLAPQIHPAGGNVIMNANVFRNMDRVTYQKFMSGQPKVIITLEQGQDWDMSKPLLLPTGHAVRILSMDPTTNTAVIDASSIGTPQVSNNEDAPPGINKMATVEGGVITGQGASYHGAFNGMLNELSLTNGLKRVSMLSIAPHYRELAKFLLEQQAIVERSGQIFTMDHANKHWMGSIEDDGRINLSRTISGLDVDAILLHEAIHRFVSWTQNAPINQLDARGLAFRRGMEDLYMEARTKLPNSKLYGFKNVQEFVAEGMTNPEFQNELRKIDGGPKQQSLWRRFVAWVNKLMNIQTDQTVLERLMDQTYGYIRYTSEQGQSFNEQVGRGELYGMNKMADAASHGVHPNRPPVVDIRDMAPHLMSSSKSEVAFDTIERDELTNHIFNNNINRQQNEQYVDGIRFNIQGMDDLAIRDYIYTTVVPQLRRQFGYRKDDLTSIFNQIDFKAGWEMTFGDAKGEPLAGDNIRDKFAEQIGHEADDVYLRYSWLKDTEKVIDRPGRSSVRVGDLGLQHIEAFEGYDPIIQVRQSSKGKPVVTLIDVTNSYLNERKDPNVGSKLLSNYATFKFAQNAMGMVTPNSEGGMRQFLLALTAMAMEQSMPGLKINRMKVLGVKGGDLQDQSPWMYDVLKEVEILKKTPLYRIMPDKIKAVLDDKRLYDGKLYNQDYTEYAWNALRKAQQAGTEGLGDELSVLHLTNAEERAVTGHAGAFTDEIRMKAYTHRVNELIRLRGDKVEQDDEYKKWSRAIVELKERSNKGMNSNRDTSKIGANIKNMMDVQSDLQQLAIRENEIATAQISGTMNPWKKDLDGAISELDKVVWSSMKSTGAAIVDLGWKRYERIVQWSAATEEDVALGMEAVYANTDDMRTLVRARINAVHWNEKHPYTAHLLKTNQITRAELRFGDKVATEVQTLLVQSLVHKWEMDGVEHRDRSTGVFDRVKANSAAMAMVQKRYPKGHYPSVLAPFSEQISQGKITSALKALWDSSTNTDNVLDDDVNDNADLPSYKVANRYLGELSYHESGSPLGSSIRLSRMGLMVRGIDGATVLDDPKLNEKSTMNLEVMLTKLKLAVTRQIEHETRTIPVANAVRAVMGMVELETGKKQTYNKEMLSDLLDRVRGGSSGKEKGQVTVGGVSIVPGINLLMTATSLTGVALSWKVGLASALYSSFGSIGTAVASDVANDGLAGTKEWAQAGKVLLTKEGHRKMGALMDYYAVWENQESDMAGGYRKTKSRKLWFSGHGMNVMNWYPDYKMRGAAMVAQMIKDGNWDAHSLDKDGNVTYDQMKDRRFYKADGTITEDGRILMNGLKERLVVENTVGQTMDKPLKAAYDKRGQGILKWVSDKYVQGGMDRSQQTYQNNVWYGRMFTTFKKFLETRIGHWYLRPTNVEKGGQWVVATDPNTGEKAEMWEKREITSYLYALISTATKAKEVMQMGWGEVEGLSKAERRSLSRLAVDLTFFALLFMVFKALDPDEEERKEMRRKGIKRSSAEIRFTTMFQDMAWDQFAGSPWSISDTFSGYHGNPIPALGTARTLLDMTTDITKIKDLLPGKTTARDLYDLYERSNTPE
jgi:hypothetical protein